MAINKEDIQKLLQDIDNLFELIIKDSNLKNWLKDKLMGPAVDEIKKFIEESRSPKLYLVGRSGHGKSSLINALANQKIAEIGEVKPTTKISKEYIFSFEEFFSKWIIIDSRGIFETTPPDKDLPTDVCEEIRKDIVERYKPDVILHIISAPEIRNLSNDLKFFSKIMDNVKKEIGANIPTIVVLNKVDTLGNPREWPPENYPQKMKLIREAIEYIANDVLKVKIIPIFKDVAKGCVITDEKYYFAIIPVCALWEEQWNVEILAEYIGEKLPNSAKLQFYQAQRRKALLRKISSSIIKRFATIAGIIGISPIPISDILILTPLQILMINIIIGLSCRKISEGALEEFIRTSGITLTAGLGLRFLAQQLVKLIPGAGPVISGAIAASGTYGIGKSAEAYFFSGEIKKPEEFKEEWKDVTS